MKTKPDKSPTQTLADERTRLMGELEALQNKIRGLDLAIALLNNEAVSGLGVSRRARGITETIRTLLRDAGPEGLSVQSILEHAADDGHALNKTSVSSLLSRMKRDGEVIYRRKRYAMK